MKTLIKILWIILLSIMMGNDFKSNLYYSIGYDFNGSNLIDNEKIEIENSYSFILLNYFKSRNIGYIFEIQNLRTAKIFSQLGLDEEELMRLKWHFFSASLSYRIPINEKIFTYLNLGYSYHSTNVEFIPGIDDDDISNGGLVYGIGAIYSIDKNIVSLFDSEINLGLSFSENKINKYDEYNNIKYSKYQFSIMLNPNSKISKKHTSDTFFILGVNPYGYMSILGESIYDSPIPPVREFKYTNTNLIGFEFKSKSNLYGLTYQFASNDIMFNGNKMRHLKVYQKVIFSNNVVLKGGLSFMFVDDFIGFDRDFYSVTDFGEFKISDIISNMGIGLRSKVSNNISLEYILELSKTKFKYNDIEYDDGSIEFNEHFYNVMMPEISIYLIVG